MNIRSSTVFRAEFDAEVGSKYNSVYKKLSGDGFDVIVCFGPMRQIKVVIPM